MTQLDLAQHPDRPILPRSGSLKIVQVNPKKNCKELAVGMGVKSYPSKDR